MMISPLRISPGSSAKIPLQSPKKSKSTDFTKHELREKSNIISPLIEQGQSPDQIAANHPELCMSVRTLYTYIDQGLFTARNIDLKRKVEFKPRKVHKIQSQTVRFLRGARMMISSRWSSHRLQRWTPSIYPANPEGWY